MIFSFAAQIISTVSFQECVIDIVVKFYLPLCTNPKFPSGFHYGMFSVHSGLFVSTLFYLYEWKDLYHNKELVLDYSQCDFGRLVFNNFFLQIESDYSPGISFGKSHRQFVFLYMLTCIMSARKIQKYHFFVPSKYGITAYCLGSDYLVCSP